MEKNTKLLKKVDDEKLELDEKLNLFFNKEYSSDRIILELNATVDYFHALIHELIKEIDNLYLEKNEKEISLDATLELAQKVCCDSEEGDDFASEY